MDLKNTADSYGGVSIILHWLMAILILAMIAVGFYMGTLEKGPEKTSIIQIHKATGILVLLLALFRWYWTLSNEKVQPLANWQKKDIAISHASKWLLMLMILAMPISGGLMSMFSGKAINFYGLFELPSLLEKNESVAHFFEEAHELGAIVISLLVLLHILAAVKHHFLVKDDTLNRMLGRK